MDHEKLRRSSSAASPLALLCGCVSATERHMTPTKRNNGGGLIRAVLLISPLPSRILWRHSSQSLTADLRYMVTFQRFLWHTSVFLSILLLLMTLLSLRLLSFLRNHPISGFFVTFQALWTSIISDQRLQIPALCLFSFPFSLSFCVHVYMLLSSPSSIRFHHLDSKPISRFFWAV